MLTAPGFVVALSVALLAAAGLTADRAASAQATETRKVIVVIAGTSPAEGDAGARAHLESTLSVVKDWFAQISDGRLALELTIVPELVPTAVTCETAAFQSEDAVRSWLSWHGYDVLGYSFHLIDYLGVGPCGYLGLGGPGHVDLIGLPSQETVAHEIGHALSLLHSGSVDCGLDADDASVEPFTCPELSASGNVEYDDSDDVMGSGYLERGLTSFHLAKLGWLEPRRVVRGRYTLDLLGAHRGERALVVSTRERDIWIDYHDWINPYTGQIQGFGGVQFHIPVYPEGRGASSDVARLTWFKDFARSSDGRRYLSREADLLQGESLRLGRWLTVRVETLANGQAVVALEWDDHTAPVFRGRAEVLRAPAGARFKWPLATDAQAGVAVYRVSVDGRSVPVSPPSRSIALARLKPGKHVIRVTAQDRAGNQATLRQVIGMRAKRPPQLLAT